MKIRDVRLVYGDVVCEMDGRRNTSPEDFVSGPLKGAFDAFPGQEQMVVLLLNTRNSVIGRQLVTVGTATSSLAHPREVFRSAIMAGASAVVVAHNHPSGDPSPSHADVAITRQLSEAGKIIGIELLDHIIVGDPGNDPVGVGYYSFRKYGII